MEELNQQINYALEGTEDTLKGKFLTFFMDKQYFGIPIADVVQIVGMQEITPVPEFPYYAKGIINLRGNIIPLIDMRLRLNKPEIEYNERTCTIVTSINKSLIGFIVDEVDEVTDISDDEISAPPNIHKENIHKHVTGIGNTAGKIILLLDSSRILNENEEVLSINM